MIFFMKVGQIRALKANYVWLMTDEYPSNAWVVGPAGLAPILIGRQGGTNLKYKKVEAKSECQNHI